MSEFASNFLDSFFLSAPRYLLKLFFILLALSMVSAHFYDPTLLYQFYLPTSIHNFLGIIGALVGGTLIELFGPAALLISWFGLRFSSNSEGHYLLRWHYPFLLIITLSLLHAHGAPSFETYENPHFLLFPGYIGILGSKWCLQILGVQATNAVLILMLVVALFKNYRQLPFQFMGGALVLVALAPAQMGRFLSKSVVPYTKGWLQLRFLVIQRKVRDFSEDRAKSKAFEEWNAQPSEPPEEEIETHDPNQPHHS